VFGAKLLALLGGFIWIRATFPRLRIDQLTRSRGSSRPLALINLGTAASGRALDGWPSNRRWAICSRSCRRSS